MVLQLWVTVRMCVKSQRISGPETLGMSSDIMDRSSPMHGKIPVPPVLSAQAQFIVTQKLQAPLRTKILELLQKLTLAQRPSNWFCIYLSTFILLHNCSLLTEHDVGYARKHGLKVCGTAYNIAFNRSNIGRHGMPDWIWSGSYIAAQMFCWPIFIIAAKGFGPSLWIGTRRKVLLWLNWIPSRFVSYGKQQSTSTLMVCLLTHDMTCIFNC